MDGEEARQPLSLSSHPITTAPSSDPTLFIFSGPGSRSRLTLKEKYKIELKLLAHPKQGTVRL